MQRHLISLALPRCSSPCPAISEPSHRRDKPAVYCRLEQSDPFIKHVRTRVDLYGVVDRPTQEAIIATLRTARQPGFKPILVRFYEREVWNTYVDQTGVVYGQGRGKETLSRTVTIR